jgi:hypothetical protein
MAIPPLQQEGADQDSPLASAGQRESRIGDRTAHRRRECVRLLPQRVEVPFISSTPGDDRMFGRVRVGSRAPVILTRSRGLPFGSDHAAAYPLSPGVPAHGMCRQEPLQFGLMTVRQLRSGRLPMAARRTPAAGGPTGVPRGRATLTEIGQVRSLNSPVRSPSAHATACRTTRAGSAGLILHGLRARTRAATRG